METIHVPVMVNEVLQSFKGLNGIFLDCTVGLGGHAEALLKNFQESVVVGLDVDEEALAIAKQRLAEYEKQGRVYLFNCSYVDAVDVLKTLKIDKVVGILMDLGVSTLQLVKSERGFSFLMDGPLDMRMNKNQSLTAYDVVNKWDEDELRRIIFEYGEEKRYARRIASFIVKNRPISSTSELVKVIAKALPPEAKRNRKRHFATKVFQAIRIAVNNELENLKRFLSFAPELLQVGGRIAVISFHSLEDRLVKQAFKTDSRLRVLTKKPMVPSTEEIKNNPKSRSAKLRVAERI
ncbi:16S rRNA (cytosine(1402)-N(4))-methyltransferase RsmH [Pseudothermotoga thermarum]|uniref:Ribosomal RNA small subunit methyltransferase H n=1 Tax=Pseudothermotoga thermarum DSM 5069 TaxID=688269 RepID=F7YUN4_9THEM|nr:16S rRNA (cytosine(1402)-N(4))-methyltransferase RsmH [Pseudothermotoga thermarum]AEH50219.1 S-adenosyl-methyltransferase MraW [Pseudothermotoga thermarum DSM 5069]